MIYKNFLYFIIAVALFVTAPSVPNDLLPLFLDILVIPFLIFLFSIHIKISYQRLRNKYSDSGSDPAQFRSNYLRVTNISLAKALIVFTFEIYLFDLKTIVMSVFRIGSITFAEDVIMLAIFILHFAIVWYWGHKMAGNIIHLSESTSGFIADNIKFNLAIVIPWLMLTLGTDLLRVLNIRWIMENSSSPLFQLFIFALFLIIFLIAGPLLIVKLWDCKPLPDGFLRSEILKFTGGEGVTFKEILSWNSLSRSLMTAGVLGYFPFFRYLLITPELIRILSLDEILAVVSHETGHVKRKHILYYLLLFIGFALISGGIMSIINLVVLSSPMGIDLLTGQRGVFGISTYNLLIGVFSILIFILYFRFIFGYFMRNFEREADTYCFDSGIDPIHLINSFEKLGGGIREKRGSNWHHYSIGERIEFIEKCRENRSGISVHRKKVKKSLLIYVAVLISIVMLTVNPMVKSFSEGVERNTIIRALERGMEKSPMDHRLYSAAASLYHEREEWEKARDYYEKSLSIKYEQPQTLNNLAWLLVTCKDESLREKRRGLRLAKDAAALKTEAHIYDTLAEAFLLNEKYDEAVRASETALRLAEGERAYFEEQLKKMKKQLSISDSTFRL
ncbi:MAG: M48 family metalloprotease [Acidobacteriota bacterium]